MVSLFLRHKSDWAKPWRPRKNEQSPAEALAAPLLVPLRHESAARASGFPPSAPPPGAGLSRASCAPLRAAISTGYRIAAALCIRLLSVTTQSAENKKGRHAFAYPPFLFSEFKWRSREESNLRPSAPEADALSN